MIRGRGLACVGVPALMVAMLATSTGVAAQDGSPGAAICPMIPAADVAAAFGSAPLTTDSGSPFHCSFSGDGLSVYLSLQPGADLATVKAQNATGEAIDVGGHEGWWVAPNELFVDTGGQALDVSAYPGGADGTSGDPADDALEAPLVAIALGALPNLPAPPDAEIVASLKAFVPATFAEQPVIAYAYTGEMLASFLDQADPQVKAMLDALAAQGKRLSDVLAVAGSASVDGFGILIIKVAGADATTLLVPLVTGFSGTELAAAPTTTQLGGKTVSVLPMEPPIHAYASGDTAFYVSGPDAWMETFFAGLP